MDLGEVLPQRLHFLFDLDNTCFR